MNLYEYDHIDTMNNPATLRARNDYKKIQEKRMLKTMSVSEMTDKQIIESRYDKWPSMLCCATCSHAGNKTKYHKETMTHKVYRTKNKCKQVIVVHHFCAWHNLKEKEN